MEVLLQKTKSDMNHIIDSDTSTSSMDIGVNNLIESLVVKAPPKGNHTMVHYDEGLGKKGDETLSLVVYEEKEVHTVIQEDSIMEKMGNWLTCCNLSLLKVRPITTMGV